MHSQGVDCCTLAMVIRKSNNFTGERSVPLPLGLAAYCTLVDSFSGSKAGLGSHILHLDGFFWWIEDKR